MTSTQSDDIQYKPLSSKVRISYGLGDTACNIVFGMISGLLTLFYTDYAGVSVATVGLVMLISRFFDGSSDMIMGFIVNKTKSRWGKARPWILWMMVPYCIDADAIFCDPNTTETIKIWYIFVTYNLCTTVCYTAINVPYGTLSTRMTRSSREQDMLSIFRMALSPVGKIIAVTLTLPIVKLIGNNQAAWIKTMSIWAVIAMIMLAICFKNCKETVFVETLEKAKTPLLKSLKALVVNQYFWSTLILWTVTCVSTTIIGTVMPYYCKYIFGNDTWMYSLAYCLEMVIIIVVTLVTPKFLVRFNKRNLSLAGSVLVVVSQILFWMNPYSYGWILATIVLRGIGEAPLIALVFGMMGDTVEFGQYKTHIRQESLIFGGGSLGFKIGTGVTSAVMSFMLQAAGYICSSGEAVTQPDSALNMIRSIYGFGPIIIWVIAVIVLILYRLDKHYPKIMEELQKREARGEI